MLPTAASAFALGLLGSGSTPDWLASWMALVVGLVLLIAGWFAAGRERRGPGALARAGLLAPEREVVEAVGGRRVIPSVTPVLVASISLLGVLTLGAGWGAFHDRALDGALLADLAPERVVLTGTFKTDPKESTLGWSAVAQVRRVEWPEGAATLRSPDLGQRERRGAWGSPRRPRPTGRDASRPRRRGLRGGAPRQGHPGAAPAPDPEAPGSVIQRVHPGDPGGPKDRGSLDRERVPPEGGGPAPRSPPRRRFTARPRARAGLPGVRAEPSACRVGRERRDGPRPRPGGDHPCCGSRDGRSSPGVRRRGVLHDPDRCGAVGAPCGSDGLSRAGRDARGQAAHHRVDPLGRRARPARPRPLAGSVRGLPAERHRHRRDGGARPRRSPSASAGSRRDRPPRRRGRRSPRSSA